MSKIGLCMIVKNEAHVIRRCLNSVLPLIDYVLIVDTGSTDGTQAHIQDFLNEHQLAGEVIEEAWRDFAFNRSFALQKLRQHSDIDYALMIDADEILVFEDGFNADAFKSQLKLDLYNIETRYGRINYLRPQLFSNRLPFYFKGVLHEYLECNVFKTQGEARGFFNHPLQDSARSKNHRKFQDDAAILEKAIAQETDPFLIARYTFYLAQSYRDAEITQAALEAYLKRAQQGFWQEEVYVSLLYAARLKETLNFSIAEQIQAYLDAHESLPSRLEALYGAIRLCRIHQRHQQGSILGRYAIQLTPPSHGLFIEPWISDYGLLDEFSIVAYWAGHYQESYDCCIRLLNEHKLPEQYRQRVIDNTNFAISKLNCSDFSPKPTTVIQNEFSLAKQPAASIRKITLFKQLEIETASLCNRYCTSCIRNSHPDRKAVSSWFEENYLPREIFEQACHQAIDLGFRGPLCLQHYNEPLQDPRIIKLGQFAKTLPFSQVFICSNADLMSEEMIKVLDGVFDSIQIALYAQNEDQQSKREHKLRAQFKKTQLHFTKGIHIPTHFSPDFDVKKLASAHRNRPCSEPYQRMILNHKGQMLLCCDDVVGNFELGSFPDKSLEELWFGEYHQEILLRLQEQGGRKAFDYCQTCPRP